MDTRPDTCTIDAVLFDFGGVIAEEGFANGLRAIASRHEKNGNEFYQLARELIYKTGYIEGRCREGDYWQAIRDAAGITDSDDTMRNEILTRFVPRPFMLDVVRRLKDFGVTVAILSDQTNWLDELDARLNFSGLFDTVYNSYHLGKSKADESHFSDIVSRMGKRPGRVLFVDDDEAHCQRARRAGLNAIRYAGREDFLNEFARYCRI